MKKKKKTIILLLFGFLWTMSYWTIKGLLNVYLDFYDHPEGFVFIRIYIAVLTVLYVMGTYIMRIHVEIG